MISLGGNLLVYVLCRLYKVEVGMLCGQGLWSVSCRCVLSCVVQALDSRDRDAEGKGG